MTSADRLLLRGSPGSPYTQKMLALLRYRHIPYQIIQGGLGGHVDLPAPKVQLIPTFYLPDDNGEIEAVVDSTPLIRRFEDEFPGRSVIPIDPVVAFINYLLEDYADEWLTKAMFHYRWHHQADADKAGELLPRLGGVTADEKQLQERSKFVKDRQISRLYVVGSNDTTAPVIEASYVRFLHVFKAHLEAGNPFMMGRRPGSSDFAAYGQLTQLTQFDPTPMQVTLAEAPRIYSWVSIVGDLSGIEATDDDWLGPDDIPDTLTALLAEAGRTYVPQMLANAKAIDAGMDNVETVIDGKPWVQQPFPYQAKCLQWVRQEYARLDQSERQLVDGLLSGTGCEALFVK